MTSAAVGFQCPQCVAAASAGTRPARSVLGAGLGSGTASGEWVTRVLVAAQLVSFLLAQLLGDRFVVAVGLVGSALDVDGAGVRLVGVQHGELWRLLSAALLPAAGTTGLGLLSLVFALLITYLFGRTLEPDLGRWRFLALWATVAVAGNAAALLLLPTGGLTYGTQGTSFGLLAATVVVGRRLGRPIGGLMVLAGLWVVLSVVQSGADLAGPLAGAAVGAALAAIVCFVPRGRREPAYWGAVALVLVASVAVALLA